MLHVYFVKLKFNNIILFYRYVFKKLDILAMAVVRWPEEVSNLFNESMSNGVACISMFLLRFLRWPHSEEPKFLLTGFLEEYNDHNEVRIFKCIYSFK